MQMRGVEIPRDLDLVPTIGPRDGMVEVAVGKLETMWSALLRFEMIMRWSSAQRFWSEVIVR